MEIKLEHENIIETNPLIQTPFYPFPVLYISKLSN
jgi:hypothetical protein